MTIQYEAGKLAERERIIYLLENMGFQRARVALEPNGGKDDKG